MPTFCRNGWRCFPTVSTFRLLVTRVIFCSRRTSNRGNPFATASAICCSSACFGYHIEHDHCVAGGPACHRTFAAASRQRRGRRTRRFLQTHLNSIRRRTRANWRLRLQSNHRKPPAIYRGTGENGGNVANHPGAIDPQRKALRGGRVCGRSRTRIEQSLDRIDWFCRIGPDERRGRRHSRSSSSSASATA